MRSRSTNCTSLLDTKKVHVRKARRPVTKNRPIFSSGRTGVRWQEREREKRRRSGLVIFFWSPKKAFSWNGKAQNHETSNYQCNGNRRKSKMEEDWNLGLVWPESAQVGRQVGQHARRCSISWTQALFSVFSECSLKRIGVWSQKKYLNRSTLHSFSFLQSDNFWKDSLIIIDHCNKIVRRLIRIQEQGWHFWLKFPTDLLSTTEIWTFVCSLFVISCAIELLRLINESENTLTKKVVALTYFPR